jgi:glycosyltransferase involved in cell wall biosynthesis
MKNSSASHHIATNQTSPRVCVIGAGTRFLSGISYYTLGLTNAFAQAFPVSAILMRQLLPTFLYPGRQRVGQNLTGSQYDAQIPVFNGVDWFAIPSLLQAIIFLIRQRPQMVIFQWWTATVLHSYIILGLAARMIGAKLIIEFHEVLDTGEARLAPVQRYAKTFLPWLLKISQGVVMHSEFDRIALEKQYGISRLHQAITPLGPLNHHSAATTITPLREAPADCCNLLCFGVIRPYKGVEDLIRAFDSISAEQIHQYWLTIVGETWEGWTLPAELIQQSRYRERITFINRYVSDDEVTAIFAGADAVVLPYHRSSASGPLHVTMGLGLPLIVTSVGGLVEAAGNYQGTTFVPPRNPDAIRQAIQQVAGQRGQRFAKPHSWENTIAQYECLFQEIKAIQNNLPQHMADAN